RTETQSEIEGQTTAMRYETSRHTTCVLLKICAILGRGDLGLLHCRRPQAKYPLLAVDLERVFANDLRQLSGGRSPHDVHLPQTVLCGHVALRKEKIRQICGNNC